MVSVNKVKEILTGWGNLALKEIGMLNSHTKAEAERRLAICDTCPIRKGNTCSKMNAGKNVITNQLTVGCGCNVAAKAASPKSVCPLNKW